MLKVKVVNSRLKWYKNILNLYKESFPKNERLPIWLLDIMSKRTCVDFLAFYNNNIFRGFSYLIHNNNITFILYLAIDTSIRSKGYGTKILSLISNNKQNNNIILNIETVSNKYVDYKQRLNRQKFYFKNGFIDTKYKLVDSGNIYDVLYKGNNFSKSEYEKLLKTFSFDFIKNNTSSNDNGKWILYSGLGFIVLSVKK